MDRKERFLNSQDFENLKLTSNLGELVIKLIALFENEGFRFYPEWRRVHKTGKLRKNFTFKAKQPAGKLENIVTIYPMSGWLKVETYRGQYNKKSYRVNVSNIEDPAQLKPLLDDAKDIYNSISAL